MDHHINPSKQTNSINGTQCMCIIYHNLFAKCKYLNIAIILLLFAHCHTEVDYISSLACISSDMENENHKEFEQLSFFLFYDWIWSLLEEIFFHYREISFHYKFAFFSCIFRFDVLIGLCARQNVYAAIFSTISSAIENSKKKRSSVILRLSFLPIDVFLFGSSFFSAIRGNLTIDCINYQCNYRGVKTV